ncbi:MAG: thioredoxin domain-containing protein [Polyangiaceae bacterium]|nr:thioredoxin domain-containing protein [Polyangiaceae bacterium]
MRLGHLLTVARAALSTGVFACAALVVDYQKPGDPAFCAVDSACMKVRRSEVGLGIAEWIADNISPGLTLPHVALFLFLIVMAVTFFLKTKLHAYSLAAMCGLGAAFAGYLIVAQAKLGSFCPWCMVVDAAMLVAGAAAIALAVFVAGTKGGMFDDLDESLQRATDTPTTIAWGIAGTILTALPFIFSKYPVVPENGALPGPIAALQQPGKTVVVTFTDFECPHCRKLHKDTHAAFEQRGAIIHRFMVPLPFHPGAMPAALGYLCSPEDKREQVADELYTTDPENLSYEGVVKIVAKHTGGEEGPIIDCFNADDTKKKVEADSNLFDEVGAQGLPTTWVGGTRVIGSRGDVVVGLLERNAEPPAIQLPLWLMIALGAVTLAGVVVWTERRPTESRADTRTPDNEDKTDDDKTDADKTDDDKDDKSDDSSEKERA